jgi:hypothetical protein
MQMSTIRDTDTDTTTHGQQTGLKVVAEILRVSVKTAIFTGSKREGAWRTISPLIMIIYRDNL